MKEKDSTCFSKFLKIWTVHEEWQIRKWTFFKTQFMLKWTTRATRTVTLVLLQCSLLQVKVNPDRKDVKRFDLSYLFIWFKLKMNSNAIHIHINDLRSHVSFVRYRMKQQMDRQTDNKRGSKLSLWFFRWYKIADQILLQTVSEIVKTSLLCARWLIILCAVS